MKRPLLSLTIRPLDAWQSYWEDARRLQCRIAVVVVYYAVQSGSALCVIERDLQMWWVVRLYCSLPSLLLTSK